MTNVHGGSKERVQISKAVDDDDDDGTDTGSNNNNNMKFKKGVRTQRQGKKRLGYSAAGARKYGTTSSHLRRTLEIAADTSTYRLPWLSLSVTPSWSNRSLIARFRAPVRDHLCIC